MRWKQEAKSGNPKFLIQSKSCKQRMDLNEQIKIFQEKLVILLKKFSVYQKENSMLKNDLAQCKKKLDEKEAQIESLQQKVDILQLNTATMDDAARKALNKRIQSYIDDIEKCIQSFKK